MSYEGYTQVICEREHFSVRDCNAPDLGCNRMLAGAACGALTAWINEVDDTNCDAYGKILEKDLTVVLPAKSETCNHCNHAKLIDDTVFKIPTSTETACLRTEMPQYGSGPTVYIRSGKQALPAPIPHP